MSVHLKWLCKYRTYIFYWKQIQFLALMQPRVTRVRSARLTFTYTRHISYLWKPYINDNKEHIVQACFIHGTFHVNEECISYSSLLRFLYLRDNWSMNQWTHQLPEPTIHTLTLSVAIANELFFYEYKCKKFIIEEKSQRSIWKCYVIYVQYDTILSEDALWL